MTLNLSGSGERSIHAIEPLQFAPQTFWFWVKAGIGFTFGAGILGAISVVLGWTVIIAFGALVSFHR